MADTNAATRRLHVLSRVLETTVSQHKKVELKPCAAVSCPVTSKCLEPAPEGLEVPFATICTPQAVQFVAELAATFDARVDQLHWCRLSRKCQLQREFQPVFANSAERYQDWKVAPLPPRLLNRHLDLGDVSPANTKHFTDTLLAGVQGIQVDFDDGHCPTWRNQILGLHNVFRAVHKQIPELPEIEKSPVLMLRPRAWNMTEHNMMVNGKAVPGPLFDFGLLLFHNADKLVQTGSGPFFYLSKVEGASEASLWNDIFVWSQKKLGIPLGTIKACVLIENILSAYEMDEILYSLKDHSLGLNCGIWDYAASIICKFGHNKRFILPDRNKYVNMSRHFLKSYMQLVIQTCHHRGAYATGGMAALLQSEVKQPASTDVVAKVYQAKLEEILEGVDGFMVYDIRLVPHMNDLWMKYAPTLNQLLITRDDVHITGEDLLVMPTGGVTYAGLRHNIAVAILFIFNWFQGQGHFFYHNAVEDSATAEISRSQIWQWIRHQASIEDYNEIVTKSLVNRLSNEFIGRCLETKHLYCQTESQKHQIKIAAGVFMEIVTKRDFPEFITTYLNDSHIFWSFHK